MTVKRRRKRQRGGSAARETIPKKIHPPPVPKKKKKKACREAKAASGLKHDGVRTGMELQFVCCCMGTEKWGTEGVSGGVRRGGVRFLLFLPLKYRRLSPPLTDTKTHANAQLSQPPRIQYGYSVAHAEEETCVRTQRARTCCRFNASEYYKMSELLIKDVTLSMS